MSIEEAHDLCFRGKSNVAHAAADVGSVEALKESFRGTLPRRLLMKTYGEEMSNPLAVGLIWSQGARTPDLLCHAGALPAELWPCMDVLLSTE